jgi:hypothetical protein
VITHQILNKTSRLNVNFIYNACALKTLNTYKLFCSLVMRSDAASWWVCALGGDQHFGRGTLMRLLRR